MLNSVKKQLRKLWPLVFWLAVWMICYRAVGHDLLLASPLSVAQRFSFMGEAAFWRTIASSLWRTVLAYGTGVLIACALAVLCHFSRLVDELVRPALTVIRATPVASFIILALVWLSSDNVPILAGAVMVLPVVFANVSEGIRAVDQNLLEMARMYRWSGWKTWRRIVIPSVLPTFLAACEACVGLCFKATIAAEVIGTPKNAIGSQLYQAKIYLESDALLAWTLVVILMSMLLEAVLKRAFRRMMEGRLRRVRHA